MAQIAEAPGTAIPRASIRDYEGPLAEGLNIMNIPQITTNQKSPDALHYVRVEAELSIPSDSPYAWLVAQWLMKRGSGLANVFHNAVRAGSTTPAVVVSLVQKEWQRRLRTAKQIDYLCQLEYTGAEPANREKASALSHGLLRARRGGRP